MSFGLSMLIVAVVRLCLIIGVLAVSIWLMYFFMSETDALFKSVVWLSELCVLIVGIVDAVVGVVTKGLR